MDKNNIVQNRNILCHLRAAFPFCFFFVFVFFTTSALNFHEDFSCARPLLCTKIIIINWESEANKCLVLLNHFFHSLWFSNLELLKLYIGECTYFLTWPLCIRVKQSKHETNPYELQGHRIQTAINTHTWWEVSGANCCACEHTPHINTPMCTVNTAPWAQHSGVTLWLRSRVWSQCSVGRARCHLKE